MPRAKKEISYIVEPVIPMRVVTTKANGYTLLSLKDKREVTYAASTEIQDRPFLEALAKAVNDAGKVTKAVNGVARR